MFEKPHKQSSVKIGSDRSFGLVFGIVFLLIAAFSLNNNAIIFFSALVLALLFILFAWLCPHKLKPLNRGWFKFGLLLGSIINPILLAIVYLLTVLPIAIALKVILRDPLKKEFDRNALTYWEKPTDKRPRSESMFDQF